MKTTESKYLPVKMTGQETAAQFITIRDNTGHWFADVAMGYGELVEQAVNTIYIITAQRDALLAACKAVDLLALSHGVFIPSDVSKQVMDAIQACEKGGAQ